MSLNILIIGATSGIAQAVAQRYALQQAKLFLVARNAEKLDIVTADLLVRGAAAVDSFVMDANNVELLPAMLDNAWKAFGAMDIALIAHGTLPDQKRTETDMLYTIGEFRNNAESVIVCLAAIAQRFELQGKGVIAVISSVAGDRGRASNYLYGAAKAAINAYTSGLRMRLFKKGVHVLTTKPGFVATAMTANLDLPVKLTATAETVAKDICKAIGRRSNVLYTPSFWKMIMLLVRVLPTPIFKRLHF
ncbi:SDR family oxidoreductase [soil metagenome]